MELVGGLTLDAYLERVERRRPLVDLSRSAAGDDGLPPDFKATRTFDEIVAGIALGRRVEASLVLVSGQNGAGKSTCLRWYASQRPDAVYWECRSGYQPRHVLADIVAALPIDAGQGWRLQTSVAVAHLSERPRVFLLDEAQRLNYDSLDLLKYVADNTGSMFVLSASPSLAMRIERWPDIASRCPVRVSVRPMDRDEFIELYQADGFSLAALEEIHALSKGVLRTVRAMLLVIDAYLEEAAEQTGVSYTRSQLEPGHIRQIAQTVTPVPTLGQGRGA